ncbi:MAG: hypothetical protein KDC53_04085 [Saprospiraceae bacterium]|nr:hypothetical protein [Saprospiraceae bacterium]
MLEIKSQYFVVHADENQLQFLLNKYAQRVENETHSTSIPMLGQMDVSTSEISARTIKVSTEGIKFDLELSIALNSEKSLIPDVGGKVQVKGMLKIRKVDDLDIEIKIIEMQWLDGPHSANGRPLSLVKSVSALILKRTDLVENLIEKQLRYRLTSRGIEAMLHDFPPQLEARNLMLTLVYLHLSQWEMRCHDSYIELEGVLDLGMTVGGGNDRSIFVESKTINRELDTEIGVSGDEINQVLSAQLSEISERLPFQLKGLSVQIDGDTLVVNVLPENLKQPLQVQLSTHFDRQSSQLQLIDCQIRANESGFLLKTLIKLFSGKVENIIEKYFPIDINSILEGMQGQMKSINKPVVMELLDAEVKDVRFERNQITVVLSDKLLILPANLQ